MPTISFVVSEELMWKLKKRMAELKISTYEDMIKKFVGDRK